MNRFVSVTMSVFLVWVAIEYNKKSGFIIVSPLIDTISYISKPKCEKIRQGFEPRPGFDTKCIAVPWADRPDAP